MSLDNTVHIMHDLKEEDKNNILFVQALIKEIENASRVKEIVYEDKKFSVRIVVEESHEGKNTSSFFKDLSSQKKSMPKIQPLNVAPQSEGKPVLSPMVGIAYLAPRPDAETFVKVGEEVKEGQVLLLVSAMKVMNPINAPFNGRILHINVKDGGPVEFGEELLRMEELPS